MYFDIWIALFFPFIVIYLILSHFICFMHVSYISEVQTWLFHSKYQFMNVYKWIYPLYLSNCVNAEIYFLELLELKTFTIFQDKIVGGHFVFFS